MKLAQENSKENVARKHLQKQTSSATHTPKPHSMAGLLLNLQHTHGNHFVQRMKKRSCVQGIPLPLHSAPSFGTRHAT